MALTRAETLELLAGVTRVAIVGVAKNSGKTTTMGALLEHLEEDPVGLVSIGIDGETADLLVGTPKPPVRVRAGQWVVTARQGIEAGTARVEYVEGLGIDGPLGSVHLVRVLESGTLELAGIRHRADLELAVGALERAGARPIFIDGAYGRAIAAHADVSDAVIVSTGAIVSPSIPEIVDATAALTRRLTLPPPESPWQVELLAAAVEADRALLGAASGRRVELPRRSALLGLSEGRGLWGPAIEAIAVPGLVSDRVVEELLALPAIPGGAHRALLVPDGTALHASARLLDRLERGWTVRAGAASELLGVSMNPTAITGRGVDPEALAEALAERFGPGVRIFDPANSLGL